MHPIKRQIQAVSTKWDRAKYNPKDFVIISNNCWGAEVYQRLGVQYNTPFVGLFVCGPDYVKMLNNLEHYLKAGLKFKRSTNFFDTLPDYPIGDLDGIEIHFVHYTNEAEAREKWTRRAARMLQEKDRSKYFLKICDRDFADEDVIKAFHKLPYPNKISFGISKMAEPDHIQVSENENGKCVPDGVILYRKCYQYIDILKWVTTGRKESNTYSKLKPKVKAV